MATVWVAMTHLADNLFYNARRTIIATVKSVPFLKLTSMCSVLNIRGPATSYSWYHSCFSTTATHIPYGIIQYYLPPDRGDVLGITIADANTRFIDLEGMKR